MSCTLTLSTGDISLAGPLNIISKLLFFRVRIDPTISKARLRQTQTRQFEYIEGTHVKRKLQRRRALTPCCNCLAYKLSVFPPSEFECAPIQSVHIISHGHNFNHFERPESLNVINRPANPAKHLVL